MPRRLTIILVFLIILMGSTIQIPLSLEQSGFPLTTIDDLGRTVVIPQKPTRIVSLVPSHTTVLFAVGAGDQIVGVTRFDTYPPELVERVRLGTLTVVGGGFDPNKEVIVSLRPDLLLGDGPSHRDALQRMGLEDLGFPVAYYSREEPEAIFQNILSLAIITGNSGKGDDLVKNLRLRVENVVNKVKGAGRPKVYMEVFDNPIITVAAGTLDHSLIELAGGINIFADAASKFPIISSEAVIQRNPDVILIVAERPGGGEDVRTRPGWQAINAVKNNRVFIIDPGIVSPSQRAVDGLEAIASAIHPEVVRSVTLTIRTSPATANLRFKIDGREVATPQNGTIAFRTITGSHVVELIDTRSTAGTAKRSFTGWTGLASGGTNPIVVNLASDATISANFSTCLIVTAAFGSELSAEIQLLRDFRDNVVVGTVSGRSFLKVFDSYYYSFSPQVAEVLSADLTFRALVKILVVPMLLALQLSSTLLTEPHVGEAMVVGAGLVGVSAIGLVYCCPLYWALLRFGNRRTLRGEPFMAFWALSAIGLFSAELIRNDLVLPIFAGSMALSTMLLPPLILLGAFRRTRL